MKNKIFILLFFTITLSLQGQNIKIASIAPENSPWGTYLKKMTNEWEKVSNGKIKVTIFHGGILGNEQDNFRKIKLGQIQGAVYTSFGLNAYSPSLVAFSVPALIRNEDEMNYVIPKIKEDVNKKIKQKGGVITFLSLSGWIYYFSTKEIRNPKQLQETILGGSSVDPTLNSLLKKMGYKVVSTKGQDMLIPLRQKVYETAINSPVLMAISQAFAIAKNMIDIKVAPFLGALVIDSRTWNRIPKDLQEKLMQISEKYEKEMQKEVLKLEQQAISTMKDNGLNIIKLNDEEKKEFYKEFERGQEFFVKNYPRDLFDKIKTILNDYRK